MRPLPSPLTDNAQLDLSLRQLLLQLVVKREALGTVLRSRSEDIGQSSVNTLSSNLSYNLGVYNNQLRNGGSNTSSYLSLNNVTALREHHVVLDGSLYGIGSGQQDSELYLDSTSVLQKHNQSLDKYAFLRNSAFTHWVKEKCSKIC